MPVRYLDLEPLRKDTRYPFRLTDKEGKKWVIPRFLPFILVCSLSSEMKKEDLVVDFLAFHLEVERKDILGMFNGLQLETLYQFIARDLIEARDIESFTGRRWGKIKRSGRKQWFHMFQRVFQKYSD